MSKYYTPEIEEFHIGFEYQYQKYTDDWISQIFDRSDLDNEFDTYCKFRVKYLDREDIESLGFEFDKGDDTLLTFKKENICLGYRSKEHTLTIFSMDVNKDEYFLKLNVDRFAVNNIIVKNKSELKKLLKQLKIID